MSQKNIKRNTTNEVPSMSRPASNGMKKHFLLKVPASETLAINALALAKKQAGETVYNLSAGEPVISAPKSIVTAGIKALTEGKTHYPPVSGIPELRDVVSDWMNRVYGADFARENTLVTNGGKLGLYLLLQAMIRPGDEVLIPAPFWVSYPSMVEIFKGKPKILHTDAKSGWKITPKDIERNTGPKTKILILNNASNPTGVLYTKAELGALLETATKKNIFVISDEVYSGLVYDGKTYVSASSFKEYQDSVAIIQSCSKSFTLTGFRVGFLFANKEIISAVSGLLSQSTSGVTSICQWAVIPAFKNAETIVPKVAKVMQKNRDVFVQAFNASFPKKISSPASALYAFVPLSAMGWKGSNSTEFCTLGMKEANVAVVPGVAFGTEGYVRFSFGEKPAVLKAGIRALAEWVKNKPKE